MNDALELPKKFSEGVARCCLKSCCSVAGAVTGCWVDFERVLQAKFNWVCLAEWGPVLGISSTACFGGKGWHCGGCDLNPLLTCRTFVVWSRLKLLLKQ